MAERSDLLPQEIMDAERFIEDLLHDTQHPIHNRAHPLHKESVQALNKMIESMDEMRDEWHSIDFGLYYRQPA